MGSSSRSARGSGERPGARGSAAGLPAAADLVTVGRIVAPHGVRGEMRVRLETDFPERFDGLRQVYLLQAGRVTTMQITGRRPHHGGMLVTLEGIDTLDAAARLRGAAIAVSRDEVVPLGPGRYYLFEIVGLRVRTDGGQSLGVVAEVMQGPANDVYVVRGDGGEILIPALRDVVRRIDLAAGEMVVVVPSGLVESPRAR